MSIERFNQTIDAWIADLQRYSIEELTAKPTPTSWSMGQLYKHLIADTQFYLSRIKVCIASGRNSNKEMTPEGKDLFRNNSFPDERLQGAPSNSRIPQPVNKEELIEGFMALRREMNIAAVLMNETDFKGKAKHPGLAYLDASEWLQFADMHMRHHFRQKKRIEEFLISSR